MLEQIRVNDNLKERYCDAKLDPCQEMFPGKGNTTFDYMVTTNSPFFPLQPMMRHMKLPSLVQIFSPTCLLRAIQRGAA